jgi:TATA-box binding protein (TBP) (component of TFIID and TFIIIB)
MNDRRGLRKRRLSEIGRLIEMAGSVIDLRSGAAKAFLDSWKNDVRVAARGMTELARRCALDGPPASLPDLSTMTVVFETDQTNDIASLQAASAEKAWTGDERCGRLVLIAPPPDKGKFKNQVTFKFDPLRSGETVKSCKVFANGKFHMTGVRGASEALGTLALILRAIRALHASGHGADAPARLPSAKVQMLNTDFRLNAPLDLEALRETVANKYGTYCRYEPDQYPGCNIKVYESTILAFGSGCVIITGAKTLEDVSRAYAFILGVVIENPCVIHAAGRTREWEEKTAKKEVTRRAKRSFIELLSDRPYEGLPLFYISN